jgi:hypothetical protein
MTIEDYIAFLARGGTTTFVSRNPGIYGVNAISDPKPLCRICMALRGTTFGNE